MAAYVKRGRRLAAVLIWLDVALAAAIVLLALAYGHRDAALQRLIALLAESFLMFSFWWGSRRGRWFYCFAKVLGLCLFLFLWWQNPRAVSPWIMLPLIAVNGWGAGLLAFSPAIEAFQRDRRGENAGGRLDDRRRDSRTHGGSDFGRPFPADRENGIE